VSIWDGQGETVRELLIRLELELVKRKAIYTFPSADEQERRILVRKILQTGSASKAAGDLTAENGSVIL